MSDTHLRLYLAKIGEAVGMAPPETLADGTLGDYPERVLMTVRALGVAKGRSKDPRAIAAPELIEDIQTPLEARAELESIRAELTRRGRDVMPVEFLFAHTLSVLSRLCEVIEERDH